MSLIPPIVEAFWSGIPLEIRPVQVIYEHGITQLKFNGALVAELIDKQLWVDTCGFDSVNLIDLLDELVGKISHWIHKEDDGLWIGELKWDGKRISMAEVECFEHADILAGAAGDVIMDVPSPIASHRLHDMSGDLKLHIVTHCAARYIGTKIAFEKSLFLNPPLFLDYVLHVCHNLNIFEISNLFIIDDTNFSQSVDRVEFNENFDLVFTHWNGLVSTCPLAPDANFPEVIQLIITSMRGSP